MGYPIHLPAADLFRPGTADARDRHYHATVVCLKAYDTGEADRVLHLFSREHGLIHAIAKGMRSPRSKIAGVAERMAVNTVHLSRDKSLDRVVQYENQRSYPGLHTSLLKLAYVSLFAELLDTIGSHHDDCSEELFDCLQAAMAAMEAAEEADIAWHAAVFQMQALLSAGYQPCLGQCVFSGKALPANSEATFYGFSAEAGGVLLPEHRGEVPASQVVNVSTATLRCLETLTHADWQAAEPCKVQKFLGYYWTHKLHKPLQTLPFVIQLLETGP